MDDKLSFTDIRFLRKVRDINANPDVYERTDKGKVPASTGAILKASDLSESEVRYRMGGSRCRGLAEMGLTVIHEAEFDEETKMFGAKSVELTQKGIDVLTEFEQESNLFEDDSEDVPEVVKQLRGRVNKLEQERRGSDNVDVSHEIRALRSDINRLETKVDGFDDDPYGALDTEVVRFVKEAIKSSKAMVYIFKSVFGIDVDRRVEDGSYPSASAIEAERVDVYDNLSTAGYSEDSNGDGGANEEEIEIESESASDTSIVSESADGVAQHDQLDLSGEAGVNDESEGQSNTESDVVVD